MSNLKILNTKAYADSVAKKKIRTKSISAPKASYKQLCRKQQRKLCTQKKQLKRLRVQNKDLKKEVKDLKEIVQRLLQGDHDIDLDGGSQADMEKLLLQWNSNEAALRTEINLQDSTGTLDLFWREQLERQSDPKKKTIVTSTLTLTCLTMICVQVHVAFMGTNGRETLSCAGKGEGSVCAIKTYSHETTIQNTRQGRVRPGNFQTNSPSGNFLF